MIFHMNIGTEQDSRNFWVRLRRTKILRPFESVPGGSLVSPIRSPWGFRFLAPQTGILGLGPSRSKQESNLKETAKPAMVEAVRLLQGFGYWA